MNKFVRIKNKKNKRVMNTKLTLTIEKSVIEKAKEYARDEGKSLSSIVENYLKVITKKEPLILKEPTPITSYLKGSFKAPKDSDYKKEIKKGLSEKYFND